jgi:hypothetical protein
MNMKGFLAWISKFFGRKCGLSGTATETTWMGLEAQKNAPKRGKNVSAGLIELSHCVSKGD